MLQQAVSCYWSGPLYSSCGCCGAWCMFGWKQWTHHVEWIFCLIASLVNNNHTNKVLFWENFNHDTCLPLLHFDFVILQWAVLLSAFTTLIADWSDIFCMLVDCSCSLVGLHKGFNIRLQSPLWYKAYSFVIQCSSGVCRDYGASAQQETVGPSHLSRGN